MEKPLNSLTYPWVSLRTLNTTLLQRWININDVDSTSQQRCVPSEKFSYYWVLT